MAGDSKEAKKLGEEIFKAYRANGTNSLGDESATTMGKAYSRLSGGMGCYIPVIWDSGCSKTIVSEEAVRALGTDPQTRQVIEDYFCIR